MIGGKVVFTYKRKRQLSRTDFYHDNELPNKSACTVSDTSATSNKHEEGLLENQKPENQKKDNYVDVPEGKRLCSNDVKEDTVTSFDVESFNKIKDEQLPEEFDTKESAVCSRSQLENGPVENGCDNNPGNAFTKDSYAEDMRGPCSCIISSSELEHKCTMDSDLVDLKPSTETGLSEGTDPPSIDKPHSSSVNAIGEKKFNSPLITFRRRSKIRICWYSNILLTIMVPILVILAKQSMFFKLSLTVSPFIDLL